MITVNGKEFSCPVAVAMSVLGGKWKLMILSHLHWKHEPRRFGELQKQLVTISEKVLAEQLKELQKDGLIHKKIYPESPPRVEYTLTESGKKLAPLLEFLCDWGIEHLQQQGIDYTKDVNMYI